MMIAKTIQGKMVDASDYQPIVKSSLYCPGCGGKVIFKKGVKVIAHFAHVSLRDCASFSEGESAEHLAAKVLLKGWMQNAIVEAYLPQLQQRPDLLWGKLAIEVQCSPLSFTRYTERTTQYFVHGYLPWWILGGKLRPHKKWTTFQKACCYYQKTRGLKLYCIDVEEGQLLVYYHIQWHYRRRYHYERYAFHYRSFSLKQVLGLAPSAKKNYPWHIQQFKCNLKEKLFQCDPKIMQLQEKIYLKGGHLLYLPDCCYKESMYFFFFEETLLYLRFCYTKGQTFQQWVATIQEVCSDWPYPLVSQQEILHAIYAECTELSYE